MLELFAGAGGCTVGYQRAGFEVTAVDRDVTVLGRNPADYVEQGDAMLYLTDVGYLSGFDVVHASPPCQMYSSAMAHLSAPVPRLIEPVRAALLEWGGHYVIENVPGAPLLNPAQICGTGLGLRVYRHRLFESDLPVVGTGCDHTRPALNPHNQPGRDAIYAEFGPGDPEPHWRAAMGVPWMHRYDAREAIPPAYAEHVGRQLHAAIAARFL